MYIFRDKQAQAMMLKDDLRWTGGCKVTSYRQGYVLSVNIDILYIFQVMLLLAFVLCLDDNINQLTDVT